jgi:hypothetical protein
MPFGSSILSDLPDEKLHGNVLVGEATFDPPATPLDDMGQGNPYGTYGFGAQVAEVEVDVDLGTVKVLHVWAAHDVGAAINPTQVEGQVHGGVAQGLGLALMEEYLPGRTENLHDYLIPTFGDVPPIDVYLIEDPEPTGPYGAKGIGEPALIPTPPAIFGAIHHATGVRMKQAPATPDRVRAAILAAQGDKLMNNPAIEAGDGVITCDACPVLCRIRPEKTGACSRYGNVEGKLTRTDPLIVTQQISDENGDLVPFLPEAGRRTDWDGTAEFPVAVFRDRYRCHHDLSRLQAGTFHRLV